MIECLLLVYDFTVRIPNQESTCSLTCPDCFKSKTIIDKQGQIMCFLVNIIIKYDLIMKTVTKHLMFCLSNV